MGQLLLKSRAVGLDCKLVYILGKPVQDRVLDNYFWQIGDLCFRIFVPNIRLLFKSRTRKVVDFPLHQI